MLNMRATICLECAAIFRHLAVNEPVSALGLYKSNDDHTQSDDLRDCFFRIGGDGGGNLACVGAGLSDPSGTGLFTKRSSLSVGSDRLSGAAPSPKMRSDRDSMIAANRKRKPGSMARVILRRLGGWERGGH